MPQRLLEKPVTTLCRWDVEKKVGVTEQGKGGGKVRNV